MPSNPVDTMEEGPTPSRMYSYTPGEFKSYIYEIFPFVCFVNVTLPFLDAEFETPLTEVITPSNGIDQGNTHRL